MRMYNTVLQKRNIINVFFFKKKPFLVESSLNKMEQFKLCVRISVIFSRLQICNCAVECRGDHSLTAVRLAT